MCRSKLRPTPKEEKEANLKHLADRWDKEAHSLHVFGTKDQPSKPSIREEITDKIEEHARKHRDEYGKTDNWYGMQEILDILETK